jgi:hypothetical protein
MSEEEWVNLKETKVSEEQIDELKLALKRCRIRRQAPRNV